MSSTGGSVNFIPRWFTINVAQQNETRSGLSDRTNNIFCNSLQPFSHSPKMNKNCTLSGLNYNVLNIYDKRLPGSYVDHLIINTDLING
jgi:hypothetical protein